MANVLIGIVGVILFIGLALAGASFFGPVMTDSLTEAKAGGVVQVLSTTTKAVVLRNREQETSTPGSPDGSVLVPEYMPDLPVNPLTGGPVFMINGDATTSGGSAEIVATKLAPSDAAMCLYIDRQGGGTGTLQTLYAFPTQPMGCARSGVSAGPLVPGDLFAYGVVG